jgi:hypothetical protein
MCEKPSFFKNFSHIARVKVDAKPLGDDPLEVDPPPADDALLLTIRAGLDDLPVAPLRGEPWGLRATCRWDPPVTTR